MVVWGGSWLPGKKIVSVGEKNQTEERTKQENCIKTCIFGVKTNFLILFR